MDSEELKKRTFEFASKVVSLAENLPAINGSKALSDQFLRSGTSVGANYRAACRAKSKADFISKMGTVEEECDECLFWLDLIERHLKADSGLMGEIREEGNQILKIVVASIKTAKQS